jgi:serine/threonine-protein kinase HipA
LLRADESPAGRERWSYVLLVEELRRLSANPQADAAELFRRMVFNALISNIDDHPRNHAVIAREEDWRLSPAYDLTPTSPVALEQRDLAMACGGKGRFACRSNLLSENLRFLVPAPEAEAIVTSMTQQVSGSWYNVARAAGVSEQDCERIKGAFVYPGFAS